MKKIISKIKEIIGWFKSSQEEKPGIASSMRLAATCITLNILGIWSYTCIKTGQVHDFGLNTVILIATVWGCKIAQHFSEKE